MMAQGSRRNTISPALRQAITIYKRNSMLSSTNKDESEAINSDGDANAEAEKEAQIIDADLARLIEQTYQYIYSVEDKRL